MSKIYFNYKIPEDSIISENFENPDYIDSCYIISNSNYTVDQYLTKLFVSGKWTDKLMKLRNTIVKHFGLKTEIDTIQEKSDYYSVGKKAVLFTVSDRNDQEIILAENDKHLNFKVSVLAKKEAKKIFLFMTTIVKYNNFGGRLYFFFVKPFHKIIVKSTMKKYLKKYE